MDLVQVTCCPSENSKYKNESAVAFIWLDQFKVRPIDWGNIEGKFGTLRSEDLSSLYLLSVSSCYLLFALVFIHSFIHSSIRYRFIQSLNLSICLSVCLHVSIYVSVFYISLSMYLSMYVSPSLSLSPSFFLSSLFFECINCKGTSYLALSYLFSHLNPFSVDRLLRVFSFAICGTKLPLNTSFLSRLSAGKPKSTAVADVDLSCPCNLKENSCDVGCCCDTEVR